MGWENDVCRLKPISISKPAKSLHVRSGGHRLSQYRFNSLLCLLGKFTNQAQLLTCSSSLFIWQPYLWVVIFKRQLWTWVLLAYLKPCPVASKRERNPKLHTDLSQANITQLHISAHRGRRFRLNVDAISA